MKIQVYSKTTCPYCQKAKEYLSLNGIPYEEIVQDSDIERNAMYDRFGLVGMQRTVPQVVVVEDDGRWRRIGGYNDLIRTGTDLTARQMDFSQEF